MNEQLILPVDVCGPLNDIVHIVVFFDAIWCLLMDQREL